MYVFDDGGRSKAGYKGDAGDCVARAIAIASGLPYKSVYDQLALGNKKSGGSKSARNGIYTKKQWFKNYMISLGFEWTPTMTIGSGCRVHLDPDELPSGRLVVNVSKHFVAVVDGVVRDTYDPTRGGKRCVYGYWTKK